jgi:glycosyltransferase involved in cell wall biosynthesis
MPKRKILMLHSSSDLYGASKILLTTIELIRDHYEVYVALSEEGPLSENLRSLGIKVYIIRLGILRRKYFSVSGLCNRFNVIRLAVKDLSHIVRNDNIDIIYSNTAGVLAGAFAARRCNVKHVWHIHEIIVKPKWFSKVIGYLVNFYSTKVIVVSKAVKDNWTPYIKPSTKLEVVYNGIDYSPYQKDHSTLRSDLGFTDEKIVIGMIGRVHFWKGQEYFLRVASRVIKANANVHFVMVGDAFPGYEFLYDELNALKKREGITEYVTDLGYRTDIANLLNGFDVFVSPSILPDPLPTVILEAMGSAKAVVATGHGGALEMVVDDTTGIFIPWDNVGVAAAALVKLIADKNKIVVMGQSGRKRVLEHFSQKSYADNMLKVLDSVV